MLLKQRKEMEISGWKRITETARQGDQFGRFFTIGALFETLGA